LVGENVPYPTLRDRRDLSKNREALLRQWRASRLVTLTESSSTTRAGGGN